MRLIHSRSEFDRHREMGRDDLTWHPKQARLILRDGKSIYMGVPFLANALLIHEAELDAILANATDEELSKVTEES